MAGANYSQSHLCGVLFPHARTGIQRSQKTDVFTGKPTATYNTCNTCELAFNVHTKPALLTTGAN